MINVIGIDPGPATGIVTLSWPSDVYAVWWPPAVRAYQCNADAAPVLLEWLLTTQPAAWAAGGIEEFRRGRRASHLTQPRDGKITADLVVTLREVARSHELVLACRPAATVKPWANDHRFTAAGLAGIIPAKMKDAVSAGQQAMYAACHDAGVPDPLSRRPRAGVM